jgi:hypothetical protein
VVETGGLELLPVRGEALAPLSMIVSTSASQFLWGFD